LKIVELDFELVRHGLEAQLSVIVPVFNQAEIIGEVLRRLQASMSLPFELLVLEDSSEDDSLEAVRDFIQTSASECDLVARAAVYRSRFPMFETGCDNFLASKATTAWLLEVQADMMIFDPGFDSRMISAASKFKLFAVSGRGVHSFELAGMPPSSESSFNATLLTSQPSDSTPNLEDYKSNSPIKEPATDNPRPGLESDIFPTSANFCESRRAGRLDASVESFDPTWARYFGHVWIGDTVMRGPLLIRKGEFDSLGGLDNKRFYLGGDEHDLFYRARGSGLQVGFTPVAFTSQLAHGSTRKKKPFTSIIAQRMYQARSVIYGFKKA
jgi:hypothetical protein